MGGSIKAIETYYKGYRFRSRLEARWAVFFDALNILYQYEYQGYNLGFAGCYLPDFWLPRHNMYVEIKGYTPSSAELEKVQELCKVGEWITVIMVGDPFDTIERHLFMREPWQYGINTPVFLADSASTSHAGGLDVLDVDEYGVTHDIDLNNAVVDWQWFPSPKHRMWILLPEPDRVSMVRDFTTVLGRDRDAIAPWLYDAAYWCLSELQLEKRDGRLVSAKLRLAQLKARQARFEHGERP